MAARPPQHDGAGWFTTPAQVNHRRYEALRAFFVDGLTYQQTADRFGYTRWAMINLVREWRAGRLELFAPTRKPGPPPGVAPAKERVRGRVIQLRRQGLSTYEISARLATEQTPLNRTSVAELLAEEGFGRLLRGPGPGPEHRPGHPRPRHPPAPGEGHRRWRLAAAAGHDQGRAAAGAARPGRPGPARPGQARRLPQHPGHPRHLLATFAAGPQAHQNPAGVACR